LVLGGLLRGVAASVDVLELTAPAYDRGWQVTSFTLDADLANQRVFDIAFERDGTVWLASSDGLRRYDGYHWQRFGTADGLPSSFTRAVLVTAGGELWVGSDAGAGVFDWATRRYDPRGSEKGLASSNVRQIVEDPDGGLWFACDQWPDTSEQKGGLSLFRQGRWMTFARNSGLPVDYVIGYFRDSQGRQFAMTPRGWMQRSGETWTAPLNPGYEAEDQVLQMAEAADGTLFAQGEQQLLVLQEGRWQPRGSDSVLVTRIAEGRVAALVRESARGRVGFALWDGHRFVQSSTRFAVAPGARLYRLREAPDGSLWCVGSDTVVRWSYRAGPWTYYPQLPPPQLRDAQGRVWFGGGFSVTVRAEGRLLSLPHVGRILGADRTGVVCGVLAGDERPACSAVEDPRRWEPVDCGIRSPTHAVSDATNGFWLVGLGDDSGVVFARREGTRWRSFAPAGLAGWRLNGVWPDPQRGLWVSGSPATGIGYGVAWFDGEQLVWDALAPARPPLMYPSFSIAANWCWLQGYSGLYRRPLGSQGRWEEAPGLLESGFATAAFGEDEILFHFTGGPSGRTGCALFYDNRWQVCYGSFYRVMAAPDRRSFYLAARGGLYVRTQSATLDLEFLPLPSAAFVGGVVPDLDGSLWIGDSDGVLHHQPPSTPPDTVLRAEVTEIQSGAPWPVTFGGITPFTTRSAPEAFRYSWRLDGGEWREFQEWPGPTLTLPALAAGSHRLEARARDWAGHVDPTPAALEFVVLPVPLQQRIWFKPLVALVVVVLALLSWLRLFHTRQIARTNAVLREEVHTRRRAEAELEKARSELERRVAERTAELLRTNASLSREIEERRTSEDARRRLEEQLRQAQKLEAIGTLAGGIAHDFNNILAAIIPFTHLAIEDSADQPTVVKSLNQVLIAAERARSLVQQILAFSRQQRQEPRVIDLKPLVREVHHLLRSAMPTTVNIVSIAEPDVPPVLADPTQIHQLLMNLCTNAEHAMRGRHGRLEIRLGSRSVEPEEAALTPGLQPGRYVRLTVRDNGCGMTPELQERIFDPFFSTKAPGEGTGLGLAVVHGIVKNCEGVVRVHSQVGEGSEFEVLLPAQGATGCVETTSAPGVARGRGERILLVDDEPAVAHVLSRSLERNGYRVTPFTDPKAALESFRAQPEAYDVLLTDLTMAGLTGVELSQHLHQIQPGFPVILATGFGGEWTPEAARDGDIRRVLQKPFDVKVALSALREVLETQRAVAGEEEGEPGAANVAPGGG
jgi:signal transduction histidine kinase/CheY-like chemotaxis protein/streptogramin lyase